MYHLKYSNRFKKEMKRCGKRGYNMRLLLDAIALLVRDGRLPAEYRPHRLRGDRNGQWECHLQPDWLLVWEQNDTELILLMLNTGTHADLFEK
ncbi:MAG: type II toxin-antitoxin system YafQ family toxin [Alloprevotella sp.]|nr:type II toxin-antitoxin system YafQ family toxin [Alloprevotella sp.]